MTDYCDNASARANDLGVPGCVKNKPTTRVIIEYDSHGIDKDVVEVCDECAESVIHECDSQGYHTRTMEIDQ